MAQRSKSWKRKAGLGKDAVGLARVEFVAEYLANLVKYEPGVTLRTGMRRAFRAWEGYSRKTGAIDSKK